MSSHTVVPFFISHRGCPHQCVFCDQVKISGAGGELPSAEEILGKIAAWSASAGDRPVEAAFFGGTFTSLRREEQKALLEPLKPLRASGRVSSVRISTRPDALDPDTVAFLRSGCVTTVELGVQSMDDSVLQLAGRGHSANDVEPAVRYLREGGMAVGIQLMPGLPGDTPAKSLQSLHKALALGPDFLRIYPTVVIAGTGLETLYRRGDYSPMTINEAVSCCKVLLREALAAGVRVARVGLQPSDELSSEGTVVAGPYHPAFRQLVESELFFDLAAHLAVDLPHGVPVTLRCSPSRISDVVGQRRSSLARLEKEHGVKVSAVKGDAGIAATGLAVETGNVVINGDIVKDLHYSEETTFVR